MKYLWHLCSVSLVALSINVAAAGFDLKGLRIGDSEATLKRLFPSAACGPSARDPKWDQTVPATRSCTVKGFTLAEVKAFNTQFLFVEDRLGYMLFSLPEYGRSDILLAFSGKYGKPSPSADIPGVRWNIQGARVLLTNPSGNDLFHVSISSSISDDRDEKLRQFKLKHGKNDI